MTHPSSIPAHTERKPRHEQEEEGGQDDLGYDDLWENDEEEDEDEEDGWGPIG